MGISTSNATTLKVLHYNIKELDSQKIKQNDAQLAFVQKILNKKSIDILSLNEIQYDQENIPDSSYKTNGRNIEKLRKLFNLPHLTSISFHPANTGENAKTKEDGTYFINPNSPQAREYADQLNFGTMPGQYSTAGLFRYKVIKEKIIKDLSWKSFNPTADFSKFKMANGDPFPDDMKLFDKNFSDISLDVEGKVVHIILLHTVPSYHFGNKFSINMYRNAEQLKFLEWYLTGNTDRKIQLKDITPLKKTDSFIAMGDFNVDVKDSNALGGIVLQRLFGKLKPWIPIKKMSFTNSGSTFNPNNNKLLLDYIITSKNIKVIHGEIMHPDFEWTDLGCATQADNDNKIQDKKSKDYIKVDYQNNNQTCYAYILKDYYYYIKASDHYPLYGEFEIK